MRKWGTKYVMICFIVNLSEPLSCDFNISIPTTDIVKPNRTRKNFITSAASLPVSRTEFSIIPSINIDIPQITATAPTVQGPSRVNKDESEAGKHRVEAGKRFLSKKNNVRYDI